MSRSKRRASHAGYDFRLHLVWITKYSLEALDKEIGGRVRELVRQYCSENDIYILKGRATHL